MSVVGYISVSLLCVLFIAFLITVFVMFLKEYQELVERKRLLDFEHAALELLLNCRSRNSSLGEYTLPSVNSLRNLITNKLSSKAHGDSALMPMPKFEKEYYV